MDAVPGAPSVDGAVAAMLPVQPVSRRREGRRHPRHPVNPAGLEQRCVRSFPRVALVRGREYFRSGYVSDISQMGNAFSLTVQGRGELYNVWVDYSQAEAAGSIEARCTCPFYATGGLCKHLWASVIKLERSGLSEKVPGAGPLRVLHEGGKQPQSSRPVNGHGPAPLLAPRAAYAGGPTGWLHRLEQIQGKGGPTATGLYGNLIAAFVIQAADTASSGKLILDFWPRRKGHGSDAGPLRPGRAPERDFQLFAESRDQELVALLTRTGDPKTVTSFGSPCTSSRWIPFLKPRSSRLSLALEKSSFAFPQRIAGQRRSAASHGPRKALGSRASRRRSGQWLSSRRHSQTRRRDQSARRADLCPEIGLPYFRRPSRSSREPRHAAWVTNLRTGEFLVPQEQGDILLKRILTDSSAPRVTWPDGMGWKRMAIEPKPKGVFRPLGNDPSTGRMTMTVSFDYAGHDISLADESDSILDLSTIKFTHAIVFSRNRL